MKKLFLIFSFFLCFGCQYQWSLEDTALPAQASICVPYVPKDDQGIFTNFLIYFLTAQTSFTYSTKGADYVLLAEIINEDEKKIGYRRDRDSQGAILKNVVPTEGRSLITAEVKIENTKGEIAWGPYLFSASTDYDYVDENSLRDLSFIDQNNQRQTVLNFSLGQLESIAAAQDGAKSPLYRLLAKKIIEALSFTETKKE